MKLLLPALLSTVLALSTAALPKTTTASVNGTTTLITFDTAYDDPSLSLSSVSCSNGEHGLVTKGYASVSQLPTALVGGAPTIKGWNSENCGACYALTYKNATAYVLAIDAAINQFNVAEKALDQLTGGHAADFGSVEGTYELVEGGKCGLK
jgi:hypothetical protein